MRQNKQSAFEVNMKVWKKDNRGLFDYSAPADHYKEEKFNLKNNCTVYRDNVHGENVFIKQLQYFTTHRQKVFPFYSYVCNLDRDNSSQNGTCKLKYDPNQSSEMMSDQNSIDYRDYDLSRNTPYIVVNNYETKCEKTNENFLGFPLKLGSDIKVGLFKFKIVEVKTNETFKSLFSQDLLNNSVLGEIYKVGKEADSKDMNETTLKLKDLDENNQQDQETTQKTIKKKSIKKDKNVAKAKKSKRTPNKNRQVSGNQGDEEVKSDMQSQQDEETIKYSRANKLPKKREQVFSEQVKPKVKQQKLCRICLSSQEKVTDPFITPCRCKGSCQFTHIDCLQQWVGTRTTIEEANKVFSYMISKPYCQLCKYPLPKVIQAPEQIFYMAPFKKPDTPYIILQSSNQEKQFSEERKYIIIPGIEGQNIKIGRHYQAEVKFTDLTVSRNHSEIFYKNDEFYIKDSGSKFGTLLKLDSDLEFNDQTLSIQMGRCLYRFTPLPKNDEIYDSDSEVSE